MVGPVDSERALALEDLDEFTLLPAQMLEQKNGHRKIGRQVRPPLCNCLQATCRCNDPNDSDRCVGVVG